MGFWDFVKLLGQRNRSGSPLRKLQIPLTCIKSQPTHGEIGKHSVHTQIIGNTFWAENHSEARFQRSAGKDSSLGSLLLWKGLLGHLARSGFPESLTEFSRKGESWDAYSSHSTGNREKRFSLELVVILWSLLVTSWPLKNLGANRCKGEFWKHYSWCKFKTPAGSMASR